jgi:hypothetical protein
VIATAIVSYTTTGAVPSTGPDSDGVRAAMRRKRAVLWTSLRSSVPATQAEHEEHRPESHAWIVTEGGQELAGFRGVSGSRRFEWCGRGDVHEASDVAGNDLFAAGVFERGAQCGVSVLDAARVDSVARIWSTMTRTSRTVSGRACACRCAV